MSPFLKQTWAWSGLVRNLVTKKVMFFIIIEESQGLAVVDNTPTKVMTCWADIEQTSKLTKKLRHKLARDKLPRWLQLQFHSGMWEHIHVSIVGDKLQSHSNLSSWVSSATFFFWQLVEEKSPNKSFDFHSFFAKKSNPSLDYMGHREEKPRNPETQQEKRKLWSIFPGC